MLTRQPVSVPHISPVTGPDTSDDPLDWARALILEPRAVSHPEERTRIRQLKEKERFDYARKLLEHWRAAPPAPPLDDAEKVRARGVWLPQQHALCTYKDPDLPGDERLRRAWEILHEIDAAGWKEPETLGLAGAIHKRWWELDARRHHLDQSLAWYTRGYEDGIGDGYCALNAAFVLDLLAGLQAEDARATGQPDDPAREKRARAIAIRKQITDTLDVPAAREKDQGKWWYCVTLAEAYFGRGEYAKAREWLECGAAADPAPWERESAARQIARIYLLRTGGSVTDAESTAAWTALAALYGGQKEAVRTAFTGKVGLALSGGGLRASLFHLGVLARMAEADVLRHVEVISCVSGGSIVGMHYYLALKEMLERTADGDLRREHYVELVRRVAATFTQGVQRNLRMEMLGSPLANLRMAWSGRSSRTRRLAELYERDLFALVHPELRKRRVAMSDLRTARPPGASG
jgi:tetratricopeptide (TPR) repeat protein